MQSLKPIQLAFFSYAHEDAEFALRLAKDLRAGGAAVWIDRLDIKPGQRWDRAIEDALAECSQLLVVLSPASTESTNVMDEVSLALEDGKTVLPVIHRECKIPFRLRRLQYVDLTRNYDEGLGRLLETLGFAVAPPSGIPEDAVDRERAYSSDHDAGAEKANLLSQAPLQERKAELPIADAAAAAEAKKKAAADAAAKAAVAKVPAAAQPPPPEKKLFLIIAAALAVFIIALVGLWLGVYQPQRKQHRLETTQNKPEAVPPQLPKAIPTQIPTAPPATVRARILTAVPTQSPKGQLAYDKDRFSYSTGMNIGSNLIRQKVVVKPDILVAGIKDAIAGKPRLTQDQVKDVMAQFEKDMEHKQKQTGENNKTDGTKFLEENKKKLGVKTTASGLQYKVLKEGTGPQPKATDTVTVNYRGTLIDGTEFDSSYKRGQPATFPLNGVIKGWTEGLQLMKVGSKYQFFVPSNLAYGERSVGPDVGANATLIFEVELLDAKLSPKK